jgi:hypothetical protein
MLAALCLLTAFSVSDSPQVEGAARTAQQAQSKLPYTYVDLSYISVNADGWDDDPTGGSIAGSYGFNENWFISAGFGHATGHALGVDIDQDVFSLGVGYHYPMSPMADLVAGLSFLRLEVSSDALGASDSTNGHEIDVGVRAMLAPQFELAGGVSFVDYEDLDSDTVLGVQGVYYPSTNVGLFIGLSTSSDADGFSVGVRFAP